MTIYAMNKCIQSVVNKGQNTVEILAGNQVLVGCSEGVAIYWSNLNEVSYS